MISSSLLHSQMQSALMGSSSPGVATPAMGGGNNFASLMDSPSGGVEDMGNTISAGVQGFMDEGKKVEQSLNKAVMGYGGLEQAVQDVAEYAVKVEAFKNIVDTAVGSVKAITLNMQI